MKIIDVCGYGHSGKGILTDFFREFENITVHDHLFEFNLIRIQGGIIDLKHNLVDNWSPIRSDSAIRRFKNLVKKIGTKASFSNLDSLGISTGNNYNDFFNNKFIELSNEYIDKLILGSGKKIWPYRKIEQSFVELLCSRIKNKIFKTEKQFEFYIVSNINFMESTRLYLHSLFLNYKDYKSDTIVTNNMIEPYNPSYSLNFFYDAKSIIVQRDPRDIYASLYVNNNNKFLPKYLKSNSLWKEKESFLLAYDIEKFILQQKHLYYNSNISNDCDKVLRLRFEDIILNYEETKKIILSFTEISEKKHIQKFQFFNPKFSSKNIGLWKKIKHESNIKRIESELSEFCYKK